MKPSSRSILSFSVCLKKNCYGHQKSKVQKHTQGFLSRSSLILGIDSRPPLGTGSIGRRKYARLLQVRSTVEATFHIEDMSEICFKLN